MNNIDPESNEKLKGEVSMWGRNKIFWTTDAHWGEHGYHKEEPFEPFGNYVRWLSKDSFLK